MSKPKLSVGANPKPVIERVATLAMQLGQRHLAAYGATRSRHDFTQRQLMTCLILRAYLKTTYRGVVDILAASASLRACLGLGDKLPHYTTLQKFSARRQVLAIAQKLVGAMGRAATPAPAQRIDCAAMDSTGLATTTASEYFSHRSGKKQRQWIKVSVVVWCASLLPLALVVDAGPSNDRVQVPALLQQAQAVAQPSRLYADAGYDAEWIHQRCREQWRVESLIKPSGQRADGQRNGRWRAKMSAGHLKRRGYGRRWAVESFFSALKRTMGSALNARTKVTLLADAAFKVLAYTLRR
jgi:DDE family transposase